MMCDIRRAAGLATMLFVAALMAPVSGFLVTGPSLSRQHFVPAHAHSPLLRARSVGRIKPEQRLPLFSMSVGEAAVAQATTATAALAGQAAAAGTILQAATTAASTAPAAASAAIAPAATAAASTAATAASTAPAAVSAAIAPAVTAAASTAATAASTAPAAASAVIAPAVTAASTAATAAATATEGVLMTPTTIGNPSVIEQIIGGESLVLTVMATIVLGLGIVVTASSAYLTVTNWQEEQVKKKYEDPSTPEYKELLREVAVLENQIKGGSSSGKSKVMKELRGMEADAPKRPPQNALLAEPGNRDARRARAKRQREQESKIAQQQRKKAEQKPMQESGISALSPDKNKSFMDSIMDNFK